LIADQCVYIHRDPAFGSPTIIAVHVDDMTLCAQTDTELSQLKRELASKFKVTDLGELTQILGMEMQHNSSDGFIRLSQVNYITRILESVGMSNCNPIATPIDPNVKLMPLTNGDPCIGNAKFQHDYLSGLGKLMYPAVTTRPNLAHAVQHLSQFSIQPSPEHMSALKHVFCYLRRTITLGITFRGTEDLYMYSDSNWASDTVDYCSITGYISYFSSAPISWSSQKQPTVALSTMEAEYIALAKATCKAIWLRKLSSELGILTNSPTTIFIDNQSAMCFSENPVFHGHSKHIDIRHYFVCECLASNKVILNHCASEENVADMFTKPLAKPQFIALRDRVLGVV